MISSNNQMSKEQFINQISHPRKREMATMILDGASFEELQAQNFSRTSVQEMVSKIKVHVEGLEGFKVGGETVITQTATDSGSSDSGPSDSGSSDSGSSESGPSESGSSDSGPSESGAANTQV